MIIHALKKLNSATGLKFKFDRMRYYAREFGILKWPKPYFLLRKKSRYGSLIQIHVPSIGRVVYLRAGTADVSTFESVFIWRQYGFSYPENTDFVIDGGANIGISALWFWNRLPGATIIAIEPEAGK